VTSRPERLAYPDPVMSTLELAPRAIERPSDAGWTLVGTLDGRSPARVDAAGLITPCDAGWSLDWWLGADDRWYLPAREPTVRQRRLGAGPVLETTVRIPSGDARQTVYGALVDGREAIVVEIYNDSPVPIALALAIRPYTVDGAEDLDDIRLIGLDDRVLRVGDGPALVLPRPPGTSGGSANTDVLGAVLAGRELDWELSRTGAVPNGVLLYPLPHRTSLRFLLVPSPPPIDGEPVAVAAAPDRDEVARGWDAVIDGGARLEFPDPGLTAACNGARARLLLAADTLGPQLAELQPGADQLLRALAMGGHRIAVAPALAAVGESFPGRLGATPETGAAVVAAVTLAAELSGSAPMTQLVETMARTTSLVERAVGRRTLRRLPSLRARARSEPDHEGRTRGSTSVLDVETEADPNEDPDLVAVVRHSLARLARLAGDDLGADRLQADSPDLPVTVPPPTIDVVNELLAGASSAGSWCHDDPVSAAAFVVAARSLLIDDAGDDLVLVPTYPAAWRGGGTEVLRAPTRHGPLSFAIRWHGPRPALLWDLSPNGKTAVTIRCPALDPSWLTTERKGEALLAGSAEPLPPSPGPGESFS